MPFQRLIWGRGGPAAAAPTLARQTCRCLAISTLTPCPLLIPWAGPLPVLSLSLALLKNADWGCTLSSVALLVPQAGGLSSPPADHRPQGRTHPVPIPGATDDRKAWNPCSLWRDIQTHLSGGTKWYCQVGECHQGGSGKTLWRRGLLWAELCPPSSYVQVPTPVPPNVAAP